MHFDEVYHARTATEFLQDWRYGIDHDIYEWTHPHLAKYAMAGGIVAFAGHDVAATQRARRAGPRRGDRAAPRGRRRRRPTRRAIASGSRPATSVAGLRPAHAQAGRRRWSVPGRERRRVRRRRHRDRCTSAPTRASCGRSTRRRSTSCVRGGGADDAGHRADAGRDAGRRRSRGWPCSTTGPRSPRRSSATDTVAVVDPDTGEERGGRAGRGRGRRSRAGTTATRSLASPARRRGRRRPRPPCWPSCSAATRRVPRGQPRRATRPCVARRRPDDDDPRRPRGGDRRRRLAGRRRSSRCRRSRSPAPTALTFLDAGGRCPSTVDARRRGTASRWSAASTTARSSTSRTRTSDGDARGRDHRRDRRRRRGRPRRSTTRSRCPAPATRVVYDEASRAGRGPRRDRRTATGRRSTSSSRTATARVRRPPARRSTRRRSVLDHNPDYPTDDRGAILAFGAERRGRRRWTSATTPSRGGCRA